MPSQNGSSKKVKLLCSDGKVVVRSSSDKGLRLLYVEENGSPDQTDLGSEQEIFMFEHTNGTGGKIQVSFHFCYQGVCYGLDKNGDNLKVEKVPCEPNSNHSTYLIKFEREGVGEEYTLKTVGKDPRYLHKSDASLHATFSADRRVEFSHEEVS